MDGRWISGSSSLEYAVRSANWRSRHGKVDGRWQNCSRVQISYEGGAQREGYGLLWATVCCVRRSFCVSDRSNPKSPVVQQSNSHMSPKVQQSQQSNSPRGRFPQINDRFIAEDIH